MNQVVLCPNGHQNRAGARHCSICGQPLQAAPSPGRPAAPPPQPPGGAGRLPNQPAGPGPGAYVPPGGAGGPSPALKRRRMMIVGGAIGLLLLIMVALIAVFSRDGDGDATATPDGTAAAGVITATTTISGTATVSGTVAAPPDPGGAVVSPVPTMLTDTAGVSTPFPETPAAAPGGNLLVNGDFTQDWATGWLREIGPTTSAPTVVERVTSDQSSGGWAVRLEHTGPDSLVISQRVAVPPGSMHFSGRLRLTGSPPTTGEGAAVLMLVYHGEDLNAPPLGWSLRTSGDIQNLLGQTPLPQAGLNVSQLAVGNDWVTIDIDLRQEIRDRLPTINPDQVRHITVMLITMGTPNCAATDCRAELLATGLVLRPE
jgi:hypothetical protein